MDRGDNNANNLSSDSNNTQSQQPLTWKSEKQIRDVEADKIITMKQFKKGDYIIIRKIKLKTKRDGTTNTFIRVWEWQCRRNNQQRIEF